MIRKQRLLLKLTQKKLASKLGISRSYLSKIENKEFTSLNDFEKNLINIWPPAKSYPPSASLIAKILMGNLLYSKLIS